MIENDTQNWSQTTTILGLGMIVFGAIVAWMRESFKSRREERAGAIKQAVKDGMQEFADKIEDKVHSQLKEYSEENNRKFKAVHERIDNVLLGKDKK
jgi:flagellar biosynthesis/type III secretory pathway M-ring protein FliF/YscJ